MGINNLEDLYPNTDINDMNNISSTYKHSLTECATKLQGIKHLLDLIAQTKNINDISPLLNSADVLCDELIRELK